MLKEERDERRKLYTNIESIVGQKLEDVAKEQGHIKRTMVEKLFNYLSYEIQDKIEDKIDSTLAYFPNDNLKNYMKEVIVQAIEMSNNDFDTFHFLSYNG